MRRRWKSNAQDAFAAADTGAAGAYGLEDRRPVDGLQERVELAGCAGQFDGARTLGDVDDAAAKNIRHPLHLLPLLADRSHLDKHEFAFGEITLVQVDHLDHL